MEGIPIDRAEIDAFISEQKNQPSLDNPEQVAEKQQTADWVTLLFKKGLDIADNVLEKQDPSLTHDEDLKQGYAEVTGIWASQEFTIEQLKQSPRGFMAVMTCMYFAPTLMTWTELQKDKEEDNE